MSANAATPSFSTKATSGEGGEFELPPPGVHPAVLVGLVDLGTHVRTFGSDKVERRKILLAWELTHETDSKGQNFVVNQDYTWSLNVKAALRKVVEGFNGRALADGEEFDLLILLGKPCMVTLTEGTSGSGKKFVEVTGVAPPMRGLTVAAATHRPFGFHIGALNSALDDFQIPDWMPRLYGRHVADDVRASKEFGQLPNF